MLFLLWPMAAWAGPAMVIEAPKIHLEKPVMEGDVARAEFVVVNQGDAELTIDSVTPG
jgi:hypothetical protein